MRRFKSAGHAQRFLSAFEPIQGHFRLSRHKRPAAEYRAQRGVAIPKLERGNGGANGSISCGGSRGKHLDSLVWLFRNLLVPAIRLNLTVAMPLRRHPPE